MATDPFAAYREIREEGDEGNVATPTVTRRRMSRDSSSTSLLGRKVAGGNAEEGEDEEEALPSVEGPESFGAKAFGDPRFARRGNMSGGQHGGRSFGVAYKVDGIPNETIRQVACGDRLTMVLLANGQVHMWGNGNPVPLLQTGFSHRVVQIACGDDHMCAVTEAPTRNLYTWGRNERGQLGHGHYNTVTKPQVVKGLPKNARVVHVSCGASFTIALTQEGNAYAWGLNDRNQLGSIADQTRETVPVPARIEQLSKSFGASSETDIVTETEHYYRLMVNSGREHSVSWVAPFGSFLQADQQKAMHRLSERVSELELQLQDTKVKLERARSSAASDALVVPPAKSSGPELVPQVSGAALDQYVKTALLLPAEASVSSRDATRKFHDDAEHHELSSLLTIVEKKIFSKEQLAEKLEAQLQDKMKDLADLQRVISKSSSAVHELWNSADTQRTKYFNTRKDYLATAAEDLESLASEGEGNIQSLIAKLIDLQRVTADIAAQIDLVSGNISTWKQIRLVVQNSLARRVKDLTSQFIEKGGSQIHELIEITKKAFADLQLSTLERMAEALVAARRSPVSGTPSEESNNSVKVRGTSTCNTIGGSGDHREGFADLIRLCDQKIDLVVSEARVRLSQGGREDAGHSIKTDAAFYLVSALIEAIEDSASARKKANQYMRHLLGVAKQRSFRHHAQFES